DTNPHSQLHILSQPEVIPNNSGGKENWYIKFITHYMSNLNIPRSVFSPLRKQWLITLLLYAGRSAKTPICL
ncbi:hypothetical protein, partial [Clostridium sp. DFI.1.208]|uniref:hypothetical protein n=1 Tax=Clostridium sp. DFI.1.208 TaxID=2965527 RepID=UPI00210EC109|nr:hypothetical protein [Clostridium sp. DFI.1.208]